jgi:rRNA maturation protein Rpf1
MEMSTFVKFFSQKRGDVRKQRQVIEDAMKAGATTVSIISEKTGLAKDLIVWNLVGMLKWGNVEVTGEQDEELVYSVKEAS